MAKPMTLMDQKLDRDLVESWSFAQDSDSLRLEMTTLKAEPGEGME